LRHNRPTNKARLEKPFKHLNILSKAFHTLDQEILLWKLEQFYGIRGLPHKIRTSYFQNTQQYTVVGGV